MSSLRKCIYAALLAFTTISMLPTPAAAQEAAHGRFTLTHEVFWQNTKVPAGEYVFSYDPISVVPTLKVGRLNGKPVGFIFVVPATEASKATEASRLVLEATPGGSYVSAMQLPEFGMTLRFRAPSIAAEKQMAKAEVTASATGQ